MSDLTLKLSVKEQDKDQEINYRDDIIFLNKESKEQKHFLAQTEPKGVKIKLNRDLKRRLKKSIPIAVLASASFLILGHPGLAAPAIPVSTGSALPSTILPSDLVKVGTYLIAMTTIAGTVLAIIFTQSTGFYRFLRKPEEANRWIKEILKGYGTIIAAPILILAIAFLSWVLFSGLPWYVKPF